MTDSPMASSTACPAPRSTGYTSATVRSLAGQAFGSAPGVGVDSVKPPQSRG